MAGSSKKKKGAASKDAPSDNEASATTSPSTTKGAGAQPAAIPTGVRRLFLIASFVFLASTGLPWGRRESPIQWIAGWVAYSDWSDRLLAMHLSLPLLMLVAVASRETAPRVWSRMSVASLGFFSMASLAIVSFGEALPARPQDPTQFIYLDIPRIIRSYAGWPSYAVRALMFAPAAFVAGWGLAAKGTDRAPLANRILLALTAASTALIWAPMRGGFGYWIALAACLALLALAPLVEDEPSVLDTSLRKKISFTSVLWFVMFAAIALTRTRRV